eukprot:GHVO01000004.1.p1 GENE.GHVO01000004.1~~GHVO01000004.1.p1  ORF type:complete len:114 (+),score=11.24 GHVO01000004.1:40-381(+)
MENESDACNGLYSICTVDNSQRHANFLDAYAFIARQQRRNIIKTTNRTRAMFSRNHSSLSSQAIVNYEWKTSDDIMIVIDRISKGFIFNVLYSINIPQHKNLEVNIGAVCKNC